MIEWHGSWLTHWGWGKMAASFADDTSKSYSWMKMYWFWLKFHWSLFLLRVWLTIFYHCFRLWIGANHIYASLGLNELTRSTLYFNKLCSIDHNPIMHHFVTEMCTQEHISVKNGALWDLRLLGAWNSTIVMLFPTKKSVQYNPYALIILIS